MSNPATPSYAALVARVQNSALVIAGVSWTFPTLVQPVHGGGWPFWLSTALAGITTAFAIASLLETRVWRVPLASILLACVWRGGLRRFEAIALERDAAARTQELGEMNRGNLQNALRTIVAFLLTALASLATIA